jgi:hypothetical protein
LRAAASSAPVITISVYKRDRVKAGNEGETGLERARAPNGGEVPVPTTTRKLSTGYPGPIDNTVRFMPERPAQQSKRP